MDWVHCNYCYFQPGDVEMKKFFITNCGHIYCDDCLNVNSGKECRICHVKYATIPLTSHMKSEVAVYFKDPTTDLKKQIKILEFQQGQRTRLVSHMREQMKTCLTLKKENYNLNEELNLFKQENNSLREEIKRLRDNLFLYKKKYELAESSEQAKCSQNFSTPRMHSYHRFLNKDDIHATPKPKLMAAYVHPDRMIEPNFSATTKRPSTSEFFVMSDSKSAEKYSKMFTTPDRTKFSCSYRSNKILTPDTNTPPTPDSVIKEPCQRDPLQRKIKLPCPRSGPSPATRIGFHGLSLSRPTSTPNKDLTKSNKYFKYFK